MRLDRALQREILLHLRDCYPMASYKILSESFAKAHDFNHFYGNLSYLQGHSLVEVAASEAGGAVEFSFAKITSAGLDFLEDDGGLSRILKTVPIEILNPERFLDCLQEALAQSELPEDQKTTMREQLNVFAAPVLQGVLVHALKSFLGL